MHVKTLCRGTIKFSASTVQGESVGQLKARLHKKLHVRMEDVRIVACGRELGDEALVDDMVPAAAENGSDSDPVVTLFMVLKSTSSATVSVQVKDLSGVEKQQHELTVSGTQVTSRCWQVRQREPWTCGMPAAPLLPQSLL